MTTEKILKTFIVKLWSDNGDNFEWRIQAHRLDEIPADFDEEFGPTFLIKFQYCRILEVQ